MNVLILTPDAVGSTLLQRMLTIYMQFHTFGRPIINLHELTNGLEKYYSLEFNRELVGKKAVKNWGYYQTLEEIVKLLGSVDHYKTSRLAHYHIRRRNDTIEQQIPFYNYLNENFYVIACQRSNVFEHALSMTLNSITKKLNVYTAYEKIDTFYDIYRSGVELNEQVFVNQLNAYRDYINWSKQYFNISTYFNYEKDIPRLEQFILELPVFANQPQQVTWEKNFGITFNSWNKMHYARSDIGSLLLDQTPSAEKLVLEQPAMLEYYQKFAPEPWPAVSSIEDINQLPELIKTQFVKDYIQQQGILPLLKQDRHDSLSPLKEGYSLAQKTIDQMIELGIIISGPPIKKQTLGEKKKIVKNFNQLIEIFNQWAELNPDISSTVTDDGITNSIQTENQFWTKPSSLLIKS